MNENLLRDVLAEYAASVRPPHVDLWSAVRSELLRTNRAASTQRLTGRMEQTAVTERTRHTPELAWLGNVRRIALVAPALVLALLALASLAWLLYPGPNTQTLSAAQVLDQVDRAANDPNAFGVHSLKGVAEERYTGKNASADFAQRDTNIWFEAPNKQRWEVHSVGSDKVLYFVSDGTKRWSYDPEANRVRFTDPTALYQPGGRFDLGRAFDATSLQNLLRTASESYDVQLLGEEQVAGRQAYVLDLTPRVEGPAIVPRKVTKSRLWVDQETYIVLGYEWRSTTYNVSSKWVYTSLELNPEIEPDLFAYDVPADAQVIEEQQGGPTGRLMRERWEELAGRVSFPLYRFVSLSDGFVSEGPVQDPDNPNRIVEHLDWLPDEDTVTLIQEPGPLPDPASLGSRLRIGPFVGYWQFDARTKKLTWEENGTVITLIGSNGIAPMLFLELPEQLAPVRGPVSP